jgi:uncharacterized membrane protein YhaH (DUF805 family)
MVTTCRSSALINTITSTTLRDLTRTTVPLISPSTRPNYVTIPGSSDGSRAIGNGLIIGIVVAIVVVGIISATMIIIAIVVVIKCQSRTKLANNEYGEKSTHW